jgi:hypothetical protein
MTKTRRLRKGPRKARKPAPPKAPGHDVEPPCCTGVNGSHTQLCPVGYEQDTNTCWCCAGRFPANHACLWSDKGSRCFQCEGHQTPCLRHATDPPGTRIVATGTVEPTPDPVETDDPMDERPEWLEPGESLEAPHVLAMHLKWQAFGRCTARSKQQHRRCAKIPVAGAYVCEFHGGKAPQVKRAAKLRLEQHLLPIATLRAAELILQTEYPSTAATMINSVWDRTGFEAAHKQKHSGGITLDGQAVTDEEQEVFDLIADLKKRRKGLK